MRNLAIVLVGFGIAGVVGAYFAKKELEKFLKCLDSFPDEISDF